MPEALLGHPELFEVNARDLLVAHGVRLGLTHGRDLDLERADKVCPAAVDLVDRLGQLAGDATDFSVVVAQVIFDGEQGFAV